MRKRSLLRIFWHEKCEELKYIIKMENKIKKLLQWDLNITEELKKIYMYFFEMKDFRKTSNIKLRSERKGLPSATIITKKQMFYCTKN